ncbi:hypothetical protein LBMAG54_09520 [Nitrosopumilaceae archaeon]|nr:hypothetical protein LBMAG54_09520 [Nitrosopumilaceae archaeon]
MGCDNNQVSEIMKIIPESKWCMLFMVIVGLGLIGFVHPTFALQYERPDGVASGNWASGSYTEIDETVRNDADHTKSSKLAKSQTNVVTFTISDVTDPNLSTGHIIRYTYKEDALGSNSPSLVIRLLQGTTQIASWTQSSPPTIIIYFINTNAYNSSSKRNY